MQRNKSSNEVKRLKEKEDFYTMSDKQRPVIQALIADTKARSRRREIEERIKKKQRAYGSQPY